MSTSELTIDQLASSSGVPSRTIREYQTLGLLPKPKRTGRVGFYSNEHVSRLALIGRLQQRGYSLAGIRDLIDAWEQGLGLQIVLGLDDAVSTALVDERPIALDRDGLEQLIPGLGRRTPVRARALELELIAKSGDRYIARSPALLQLVADLCDLGITPDDALDAAQLLRDAMAELGASVVEYLVREVWEPRARSGVSEAQRAEIGRFLQRGRGMLQRASASLLAEQVWRQLASVETIDAQQLRALVETGVRVDALVDEHPASTQASR